MADGRGQRSSREDEDVLSLTDFPTHRIWSFISTRSVHLSAVCCSPDKCLLAQRQRRRGANWVINIAEFLICSWSRGKFSADVIDLLDFPLLIYLKVGGRGDLAGMFFDEITQQTLMGWHRGGENEEKVEARHMVLWALKVGKRKVMKFLLGHKSGLRCWADLLRRRADPSREVSASNRLKGWASERILKFSGSFRSRRSNNSSNPDSNRPSLLLLLDVMQFQPDFCSPISCFSSFDFFVSNNEAKVVTKGDACSCFTPSNQFGR